MIGRSIRQALSDPAVRLFIIGTFLSNVGSWIQRVAIGWLVFHLTESATWVGTVAACEVIPSILVAPFGGVLADRSDRLKLFAAGQIAAQLQACMLVAFAFYDAIGIEVIVVAALALGVIEGINQPTRLAVIFDVASHERIRPAVSLNSIGFNTARFVGPAIGGAALAMGGPVLAFGINALSFTPLVLLVFMLRREQTSSVRSEPMSLREGISDGVRYAWRHSVLGPLFLLLVTASVCARSVFELLPAISGFWFDATPESLAKLTSSVGLGAIGGGLWMLRRTSLRDVSMAVLRMQGLLIVAILLVPIAGQAIWIATALLALAGFCAVASAVGMQYLIHLTVDPALRGRTLALFGLIQRAAPAIGALLVGTAIDGMGLQIPIFAAAAAAAIVWFVIWSRRDRLVSALPAE